MPYGDTVNPTALRMCSNTYLTIVLLLEGALSGIDVPWYDAYLDASRLSVAHMLRLHNFIFYVHSSYLHCT